MYFNNFVLLVCLVYFARRSSLLVLFLLQENVKLGAILPSTLPASLKLTKAVDR